MSQPEESTPWFPVTTPSAVGYLAATQFHPATGAAIPAPTVAEYSHPAWRDDRAKIRELEAKVERLLRARRVVARRHRDELAKLRLASDSLVSSARQAEDAKLRAQLAVVEAEAARWKTKYNERLVEEFRGAKGMALALEQANQKVAEQEGVLEKLREELALARLDNGDASGVTGDEADGVSFTGAALSGMGPTTAPPAVSQVIASAFDMEIFSATSPVAAPLSLATKFGPTPIPRTADTPQSPASVSHRLVDAEIEIARAAHEAAQQTALATSEKTKTLALAEQLSSARAENEDLRGRIKSLAAELTSTQVKVADAETRLWKEKISRPLVLVQDLGKANDRFDVFIKNTTSILRQMFEAVGEKLAFGRGMETRQVGDEVMAWHPEGGEIPFALGFEHLKDTCRTTECELRERKENFEELVRTAREEFKKARRQIAAREEKEIESDLANVLDDRGGDGPIGELMDDDLFDWNDERVGGIWSPRGNQTGFIEQLED